MDDFNRASCVLYLINVYEVDDMGMTAYDNKDSKIVGHIDTMGAQRIRLINCNNRGFAESTRENSVW